MSQIFLLLYVAPDMLDVCADLYPVQVVVVV